MYHNKFYQKVYHVSRTLLPDAENIVHHKKWLADNSLQQTPTGILNEDVSMYLRSCNDYQKIMNLNYLLDNQVMHIQLN